MRVVALREYKPSYRYNLRLEAEEVVACLLSLPPETIAAAVSRLRDEFDTARIIPELQKQLTIGLVSEPAAEQETEDEDEE